MLPSREQFCLSREMRNEDGDDSGSPRSDYWRTELQDRAFGAATACAVLLQTSQRLPAASSKNQDQNIC